MKFVIYQKAVMGFSCLFLTIIYFQAYTQTTQLLKWQLPVEPTPTYNNKYFDHAIFSPQTGSNFTSSYMPSTVNMMYDEQGNNLFHVINNIVYDQNGYEMASFNHSYKNTETPVVPVPGSDGLEFYIFNPLEYIKIDYCKTSYSSYEFDHGDLPLGGLKIPYQERQLFGQENPGIVFHDFY